MGAMLRLLQEFTHPPFPNDVVIVALHCFCAAARRRVLSLCVQSAYFEVVPHRNPENVAGRPRLPLCLKRYKRTACSVRSESGATWRVWWRSWRVRVRLPRTEIAEIRAGRPVRSDDEAFGDELPEDALDDRQPLALGVLLRAAVRQDRQPKCVKPREVGLPLHAAPRHCSEPRDCLISMPLSATAPWKLERPCIQRDRPRILQRK
jgi:hypothetical protein